MADLDRGRKLIRTAMQVILDDYPDHRLWLSKLLHYLCSTGEMSQSENLWEEADAVRAALGETAAPRKIH